MVRAFHAAGIEVILDVVFNHTAEGDDRGRTYTFRGLDNGLYYMLDEDGRYLNFTGCGNTINSNHPVVRDLILTCLRYWVADMHVDGFRFDLAAVLGRDRSGERAGRAAGDRERSPRTACCADTKLIAEPWDAAGLYQVGSFPSAGRWSEWNGRYRDDVRRFWRGDPGMTGGRWPPGSAAAPTCTSGPAGAAALDQLHHLPRRLHALRPGLLQPASTTRPTARATATASTTTTAWNCGAEGADRRPGGPGPAAPAGAEPDRHAAALAGRADAPGRRRVPPHPAGEQQRLVPGQRDRAGSTGAWPRRTPTSSGSSAR